MIIYFGKDKPAEAVMNISGLQKLTLLDFPGKTACTVFFAGCNFRCPFCHNASLVVSPDGSGGNMSFENFLSFLASRKGKLDGVCVSGGEPLLGTQAVELIRKIKSLGFLVKLDTNGSFPNKLKSLAEEGLLDYVAMDIKNSPEKYPLVAGVPSLDISPIKESASFLMKGSVPYEFRTTLVRGFHDESDIQKIGTWISGAENWYLQAFVDSGDLIEKGLTGFSPNEYNRFLDIARQFVPNAQLRGI